MRFSLTQKMQGLVRPLIYVVIGYGIGGPQLLGLSHKEMKVRLRGRWMESEMERAEQSPRIFVCWRKMVCVYYDVCVSVRVRTAEVFFYRVCGHRVIDAVFNKAGCGDSFSLELQVLPGIYIPVVFLPLTLLLMFLFFSCLVMSYTVCFVLDCCCLPRFLFFLSLSGVAGSGQAGRPRLRPHGRLGRNPALRQPAHPLDPPLLDHPHHHLRRGVWHLPAPGAHQVRQHPCERAPFPSVSIAIAANSLIQTKRSFGDLVGVDLAADRLFFVERPQSRSKIKNEMLCAFVAERAL